MEFTKKETVLTDHYLYFIALSQRQYIFNIFIYLLLEKPDINYKHLEYLKGIYETAVKEREIF